MTQSDQILKHLKSGNTITAINALNKFGCFRLAARINDLRNDGHDIKTEMMTSNGKTFAVYYL